MVERFNTYYRVPHFKSTGRELSAKGEYVLASDYDALAAENAQMKKELDAPHTEADKVDAITAERDELKRRYDEVNENYMGLVNLLLPHLRAAQERASAELAKETKNG